MSAISQKSAAGSFDISGPDAPAQSSNEGLEIRPAGSWQQAAGIFSAIANMLSSDLTAHGTDRQNRAELIQKLDELETTLRDGGSGDNDSLKTALARLEAELRAWHGLPREDEPSLREPVPETSGQGAGGVSSLDAGKFDAILGGAEVTVLQPVCDAGAAANTISNQDGSIGSLEQFDRLALTIGDSLAQFGVAKAHAALGERPAAANRSPETVTAPSIDPGHLDALTKRIEAPHRQLAARLEAGLAAATNETNSLKNLISGSADKTGQNQELEITNFAQRFDRAGEGLASLPSLEQAIESLSVQLEETRRIANSLVSAAEGERPLGSLIALSEHGDDNRRILREIADLRALHEDTWQRINLVLAGIQQSVEQIAQATTRGAGLHGSSHVPSNSDPFAPILTALAQHGQEASLAAKVVRPGTSSDKESLLAGEVFAANSVQAARTFQPRVAVKEDVAAGGGDPGAAGVLIEPGLGFPGRIENIEPHGQSSSPPKVLLEREEGASRIDFIAAARRAARTAQKELQGVTAQPIVASEGTGQERGNGGLAAPGASQSRRARGFLVRSKRSLVLGGALLFAAIGTYALSRTLTHKSFGDFLPAFLKQFDRGGARPSPAATSEGSENENAVSQAVPRGLPPGQLQAIQSPAAEAPGIKAPAAGQLSVAAVPLNPLAPAEPGFSANGAARFGNPVPAGNPAPATRPIAGSDAIVPDTLGRNNTAGLSARLHPPAAIVPATALPIPLMTPAPGAKAPMAQAAAPAAESAKNLLDEAKSGDAAAQFDLAVRYAEGTGSERSYELAAQWYGKAAEQGLAVAEYRLATLYERGLGVGKDMPRAKTLYQRAAEKGNIRAMHNLGVLAVESPDGKPSYMSAALWFGKAADYGIRDSQYNLAVLLARGLGLPKDLVSSYTWFAIVAAAGDADAAKKRDEVAARLTSSELAAANAAAAAFEPRPADRAANEAAPPPAPHHEAVPAKQGQPVKPKVSGL